MSAIVSGGGDDPAEVHGLERSAPDKGAVHVLDGEDLGGVSGFDRAAVEDPNA